MQKLVDHLDLDYLFEFKTTIIYTNKKYLPLKLPPNIIERLLVNNSYERDSAYCLETLNLKVILLFLNDCKVINTKNSSHHKRFEKNLNTYLADYTDISRNNQPSFTAPNVTTRAF